MALIVRVLLAVVLVIALIDFGGHSPQSAPAPQGDIAAQVETLERGIAEQAAKVARLDAEIKAAQQFRQSR